APNPVHALVRANHLVAFFVHDVGRAALARHWILRAAEAPETVVVGAEEDVELATRRAPHRAEDARGVDVLGVLLPGCAVVAVKGADAARSDHVLRRVAANLREDRREERGRSCRRSLVLDGIL